jgi:photosystem II stability/assembly factor-like uncharacterized protein
MSSAVALCDQARAHFGLGRVKGDMDSLLYIGTDAGVVTVRSRDRQSWEILEHGLKRWEISELAVSPQCANKVFAGTRGDGVWMSEDFGKTWSKPSYGKRGPGKVRSVTIDPHDPRRLYAGCEPTDVFMSEDEGRTWVSFDTIWKLPSIATMPYPLTSVEPHARDVTVDPTDPAVLYVALQLGYIIKSTDGGRTWRLLDDKVDCDVHTIVIDPADPRRLVIATGGHDSRLGRAPGRALYTSDDGGVTWTPTAMNFTQEYAVPLTRDPHDPDRLFAALAAGTQGRWRRRDSGAESVLIRSDDGGKTWHPAGAGIDGRQYPEAIVVDGARAGRLYAACRNGDLYATDDAGESWRAMRLNLKVADVPALAVTHT